MHSSMLLGAILCNGLVISSGLQGQGSFFVINDVHTTFFDYASCDYNLTEPYGCYGTPTKFSTGLFQSMLQEMVTINAAPDFIVLDGDISSALVDIKEASHIVKKAFPSTKVFVANGNHDLDLGFYTRSNYSDGVPNPPPCSNPKANMSCPGDPDLGKDSVRLEDLTELWGVNGTGWLSCPGCEETFRIAGYYSASVEPDLKIISINTNVYIPSLEPPEADTHDPAGQWDWLEAQLADARSSKTGVLLIAHVPPGVDERDASDIGFTTVANQRFLSILAEYGNDVIIGVLFGHLHSDAYKVFYASDQVTPVAVGYIAPAAAPLDQNPGFRLFTYEKSSANSQHRLVDYSQYYTNLEKSNHARRLSWQLEYSAKAYFNLSSLEPLEWHRLRDRFDRDQAEFQRWSNINYVLRDTGDCSNACKTRKLCANYAVDFGAYSRCVSSVELV